MPSDEALLKLKKKMDAEKEAQQEEFARQMFLRHGMCPDCAGGVKDISSTFRKLFLTTQLYQCQSCAKIHTRWRNDD